MLRGKDSDRTRPHSSDETANNNDNDELMTDHHVVARSSNNYYIARSFTISYRRIKSTARHCGIKQSVA